MSLELKEEASDQDILLAQRIISASQRHDVGALKILLQNGSANVRDPATGTTPLHAAIAACNKSDRREIEGLEETAINVVELLLQNGAIWNDLNKNDETPGCIALRLGLMKIYNMMVDAGVRAELLFGRFEELGLGEIMSDVKSNEHEVATGARLQERLETYEDGKGEVDDVSISNQLYLKSELRYETGMLLDSSDNAVMMDWETHIMTRHSETLLPIPGLRSLNVGHGMGIVDTAILDRNPAEHHIIEAHPQVLQRLKETGWYEKPNVKIHEGRWQDVLPKLAEEGITFDAIYYDTFAEDYQALKVFFSEWVVQLLDSQGRFGWYNGLGADRQICYDVYTKVRSNISFYIFLRWFTTLTGGRWPRLTSMKRDSIQYGKKYPFHPTSMDLKNGREQGGLTG